MKDINNIKNQLSEHKHNLIRKYHLSYIAIFGSVSRNENDENSDIDILVDFDKQIGIEFIDLADELEKILGSKVDLVSKNGIKPKYFEYIKNELVYV